MTIRSISLCFFSFFFFGCAAVTTSSQYSGLEIKAAVQRPIFLDGPYIRIQVDCHITEFSDLEDKLSQSLQTKGFDISAQDGTGYTTISISVNPVSTKTFSASEVQREAGATAAAGGVAGAATGIVQSGKTSGGLVGGVVGVAAGALTEVTINSLVSLDVLDLNVSISAETQGRASRHTNLNIRAKQVGINWAETAPEIERLIVDQIGRALRRK